MPTSPDPNSSSTTSSRGPLERIAGVEGRAADAIAYWLVLGGIYITFGFLWYYAAKEKLIDDDGNMPAELAKSFQGSFLDSVPGLDASWVLLGILEAVAFLLFAASLVTGEFLPDRRKLLLLTGLGVSIFTFAVMAFANNTIAEYTTVAELFTYFTGSVVVIALVLLMPPYRPRHWLSRFTGGEV
jgi:hypothetical protein